MSVGFLVMANTASPGVEYNGPYSSYQTLLISLSLGVWVIGVPLAALLGINGLMKLPRLGKRRFSTAFVYLAGVLLGPLMMVIPH